MRSGLREPRFNDHPDRGCSLHPSCLECPRSACRYDKVRSVRRPPADMANRDENIRQRRAEGATIKEIRAEFVVSNNTIYRVLATKPAKGE